MTKEKEYYELEMAYEILNEIETENLPEEVAGNIMEAWGYIKLWLGEHGGLINENKKYTQL